MFLDNIAEKLEIQTPKVTKFKLKILPFSLPTPWH